MVLPHGNIICLSANESQITHRTIHMQPESHILAQQILCDFIVDCAVDRRDGPVRVASLYVILCNGDAGMIGVIDTEETDQSRTGR